MAISIKNVIVLGLLALGTTSVQGHSGHHHGEDEEIVLSQSKKEELLMKWEQEVHMPSSCSMLKEQVLTIENTTVGILWHFYICAYENGQMSH